MVPMESGTTITDGAAGPGPDASARAPRPDAETGASATANRARFLRMLVIITLISAVAVVVGTALIIASLRNHALGTTAREVQNLALMLAEETDRSLQAVEMVETGLIDRMRRLNITSTAEMEQRLSGDDAHVLLKDTISGLPLVASVAIIGNKGRPVSSSRRWPLPPLSVADRDYYKALASDPELMSYLSAPIHNRVDQTRAIFLARRFVGPDNEFIGLVIGGLDLPSFEELFGSITAREGLEIALVRTDDTLLAHYPRLAATVERQDDRGQLFDDAAWVPKQDNTQVTAAHGLAHFPARISVSAPISAALADWRTEALYLSGAAALLVLMIGGVALATARQFDGYASLLRARAETAKAETAAACAAANTAAAERGHAREQLNEQKQQLRAAIDHMPQGLVMFDANADLVVCNENYIQMYHLSRNLATPGSKLRDIIAYRVKQGGFAADPDALANNVVATVFAGKPWKSLSELRDGRVINIETLPMDNGGWLAIHEDITERRRAERHLDRTQKFLASVIEHVPTTITVKDPRDLRYVLINRAGEKYFGLRRSEIIGKTSRDLFPKAAADLIEEHDRQLLSSRREVFIDDHAVTTPAGEDRIIVARRLPVIDEHGEIQFLLSLVDDVTERREIEQRLAHIKHHDVMTGLPNRVALAEHLTDRIDKATARHGGFALLSVDLDRFKEINDAFGHGVGDALLRGCVHRLRKAADGAYLAHVGGDEFVLTTTAGPQPATAEALSKRLLAAMTEKFEVEGQQLQASLSIGIALFPSDGRRIETLQANADAALHRAKAEGRGSYRFFEADLDGSMRDRRALHHDLGVALERGEFAIEYQPQTHRDGEVIGFEAVIRWHHPTRGIVAPAEFVTLAEESGHIVAIGEWALRTVCREAATWLRPLQVAVNVWPAQFRRSDLVGLIHAILLETGLPAKRLEIEITEGALIGDFSHAVSILRRLKLLGVNIAMDGFGTGYSSLSHLRSFPYDKVKLDHSLLSDLDGDPQAAAMLRGIIELAHGLDLRVLAAGVETNEQFATLHAASCDEMQGSLIGRPHPIASYAHLIGRTAPTSPQTALAS